jgi:uncharacterized OsmC-like protein
MIKPVGETSTQNMSRRDASIAGWTATQPECFLRQILLTQHPSSCTPTPEIGEGIFTQIKKNIPGGATMAKMKTISIEAKLDEKFKIEVKAGEHLMVVDQPKAGGGTDAGATPLEYLFASMAGCIGTVARIIAMQQRIPLKGMDIKVEGALDLDTLLGKSRENRAGFTGIKVRIEIDADMTRQQKEEFVKEIDSRCPVSDNIANITPVIIEVV